MIRRLSDGLNAHIAGRLIARDSGDFTDSLAGGLNGRLKTNAAFRTRRPAANR